MFFAGKKIYLPTAIFFTVAPVITAIFIPWYVLNFDVKWQTWIFALLFAAATNLSITAGYHRLFSHKSYEAKKWVENLFLFIGASAFQGSALKWSSDHRVHHTFVDSEADPYNIKKGFFYAHMGWLFFEDSVNRKIHAPDLEKNKSVMLQDKYYLVFAIFSGFLFPAIISSLWTDALGGLLVAGLLRIVLTQQSTFFVNSLCHTLGDQTYSKEITARDSWLVAVLTHGEGYHNFHHKFQIDYRNGIKWYQWDPTKWVIQTLALFGQAYQLRMVPAAEILKARLLAQTKELSAMGVANQKLEQIRERIFEAQNRIREIKRNYDDLKINMQSTKDQKFENMKVRMNEIRAELQLANIELKNQLEAWSTYVAYLKSLATVS